MSPAKSAEMEVGKLREYILSKQPGAKASGKKAKKTSAKATTREPEPEPEREDDLEPEPEDDERQRPGRGVEYDDESEAAESEETEEAEEDEEEPVDQDLIVARIDKLQKTVEAFGDMMGEFVDIQKKHRRFDRRAFAVLDRKVNCLLGSMDIIGAKVVGNDFDPLKCEESYSKKYQHTVPLGAIQKAVGDPVEEEDG